MFYQFYISAIIGIDAPLQQIYHRVSLNTVPNMSHNTVEKQPPQMKINNCFTAEIWYVLLIQDYIDEDLLFYHIHFDFWLAVN